MTGVHQLPDPEETEREASEWIARLNADDVSADDRARFEAWLARHPLNARAYEELAATWKAFIGAGPLVRAVSFAQSMNEAAARPVKRGGWALATAAGLAAVAIVGWLSYEHLAPGRTFSTAIGEHATLSLPDGSTLELNSDSLARVDYSKATRVIHLDRGEGFFRVAHDASRPFWVVGGGSWVRAVGTAFNVYLRPTAVEVTVSEGTVKVGSIDALQGADPTDPAIATASVAVLKAGEQADLHGSAADTRELSAADVQRAENWREGTIYFENQPLSAVVAELNRYTTTHIVIRDQHLGRLPVGGTFETTPRGAEDLLTMLEQGFGVRIEREGNQVFIDGSEHR